MVPAIEDVPEFEQVNAGMGAYPRSRDQVAVIVAQQLSPRKEKLSEKF